ncbi:uncharacterized protein LOC110716770 [Chenopodium quinoa]|uniref:uncharacterized protein LOC110716770 n=1 Tax=Chenopodium quinoa TaxID=63459 RepID=UPI000B7933F5|nr:uncharacterized protein LOC110716770 [Chenopodium quinoa]
MLIEEDGRCKASSSAGQSPYKWQNIWHAGLPPKVKLFAWRSVWEGLPVMSRLVARGMQVDTIFPMYGEGEETTAHMILECRAASSIWRHYVLRLDTRQVDMGSFRGWCCLMQDKYKDSKWWDVFWSIAWGIWLKRNIWIFEKKERRESDILYKAMGLIGEYEEENLRENILNTNAAFHGQILGIGGVLRDDSGAAVVAYCSTKKGSFAVDVGEAIAMRASL